MATGTRLAGPRASAHRPVAGAGPDRRSEPRAAQARRGDREAGAVVAAPTLTTTPASVLTVMAHPDDAELWAGGTLARLAQAGAAVTIAVPEHADAIRNTEAASAANELGARYQPYPTVNEDSLHELLDASRPEVGITHPPNVFHLYHQPLYHYPLTL